MLETNDEVKIQYHETHGGSFYDIVTIKDNQSILDGYEENMERIVACVNACTGIETDQLKHNSVNKILNWYFDLVKLTARHK